MDTHRSWFSQLRRVYEGGRVCVCVALAETATGTWGMVPVVVFLNTVTYSHTIYTGVECVNMHNKYTLSSSNDILVSTAIEMQSMHGF